MPVVIELGPAPEQRISTRLSPLAELCACLHALDGPRHHPASRRWAGAVLEGADERLLERAGGWAPLWGAFRARYLLPLTPGPERDLEEELAQVARLDEETFTTMTEQALVGKNGHGPGSGPDPGSGNGSGHGPVPASDHGSGHGPGPGSRRGGRTPERFLARLRQLSERRFALGLRLLADPSGFRDALLAFLSAVAEEVFEAEWTRLRPILEADARVRSHEHSRYGPAVLAGFPTARMEQDPPRVVFDKLYNARASLADHPCLLVPSLHINPHLAIKHYPGFPVVVQYPVRDGAGAEPTALDVVVRGLRALDEPLRIRMCRALLRQSMTTTELATQFEMTPPQMSRHLRKLREAGMVHTHREGARVHYQLDEAAVRNLGVDLLSALHR
ncbi:transcriptional regulator [Streptomyces antioxidans]|uniref:Transcriptional regulator n=1 Tax=Streptomyces antioxidans TaxID=1507734 RepID=A0A1V4D2Y2_9ACTN|nr:DUF5937 family protein [Streptomyces antioxidans]OPF78201.1 transcriptional regulator [Streptomyces antioxidans]